MTNSIRPASASAWRRAEFGAAMDDGHPLGDLGERERPIDRRIAAAGDDDTAAAELLAPVHEIKDTLPFERLDALERRAVRPEGAGPGRDHHGAGGDPEPGGILENKTLFRRREARDGVAQMEHRGKGRGLFDQPLDQFGGADSRIARDVVDRLFRIERGALPARRRQSVENPAADLEHAAFEHGKEPHWSPADDRDIAAVRCVVHRLSLPAMAVRASALATVPRAMRRQILRPLAREIYKVWPMIVIELPDEAATAVFAARIAVLARPGDVIALKGELGAGKTSFARAFIRARGGDEAVPSPTFTLVQVYELGGGAIYNIECYRLRDQAEAWKLN